MAGWKAMPLPGYKFLGGSSRRYVTPTGEIISRRQYDNLRARDAGWRSRSELEKFRRNKVARTGWSKWAHDVKQHSGKRPTWRSYRDLKDVLDRRAKLKRLYPGLSGPDLDRMDPVLIDPNGPLARILTDAGRRSSGMGNPVGDS